MIDLCTESDDEDGALQLPVVEGPAAMDVVAPAVVIELGSDDDDDVIDMTMDD